MSISDPEVYLTFGLLGLFDPDEVTKQFSIAATETFNSGDIVGNGYSDRKHPSSGWFLDTRVVLDDTIQPHLDWLLERIEPQAEVIDAFRTDGAFARVDCFWRSAGMSGGPWLTAASMSRLAALDLDLVISFYTTEPQTL